MAYHAPTTSSDLSGKEGLIRSWVSTAAPPRYVSQFLGKDLNLHGFSNYLDPVQEAYTEAVQYFKSVLTQDECKKVWIDSVTGIEDIQQAVLQAKNAYESSPKSQARVWLSKLSSRVNYYGPIIGQFRLLMKDTPHLISLQICFHNNTQSMSP